MNRRKMLVATGGIIGLGSCLAAVGSDPEAEPDNEPTETPTPEPIETPTPEPTEEPTEEPSDEMAARFAYVVESQTPDRFETAVDAWYTPTELWADVAAYINEESEMIQLVSVIIGAYSGMGDYKKERLDVDLFAHSGDRAGNFHAESEWADAFASGDMSAEEYLTRVVETFSTA